MSYLLSPDVTDPLAQVVLVDPANGAIVETKAGGLIFETVETKEGVSRLLTSDGRQLEQYPGVHAGFSIVAGTGAYGRCIVDGCLVAFKSRPEDQAYVYTIKRLPQMWTDDDIDRWITRLFAAKGLGYVQARKILITLRNEVGEATITEARKQKRARYLARKSVRKQEVNQ